MEDLLKYLDGFAGMAALVNGLLLWPIVKALKQDHQEARQRADKHEQRLDNHDERLKGGGL